MYTTNQFGIKMTIFHSNIILGIVFAFFVQSNALSSQETASGIPSDAASDAYIGVQSTFKLLREGDQYIELNEQYRDVTLVIGNTGSGKSTFVQWMAGDNSKLISKEVEEDTREYFIDDGYRIGSSTNSKTIFPELVIDGKSNAAYYDCPGFSDSRNASYDIASTYFIKKITDHARGVKIILTVSHPSVRKGVNRKDFITLIRHTTELIKDIAKFHDSIAIVITKVDNSYSPSGLVPDEIIARAVSRFLLEVKKDLQHKSNFANTEKTFLANAVQLLNILLRNNNGKYSRIGIFRRPDKPGPLDQVDLLQKGKQLIESILHEELTFTAKEDHDFGYTISEESKNHVNGFVTIINDKVLDDLSQIAKKVEIHYGNLTKEINYKISLFLNSSDIISAEKDEARSFSAKLNTGHADISRLVLEAENITNVKELAENTYNVITMLGIDSCASNLKSLSTQGTYFDFFQVVSNKKLNLNTKSFLIIFETIDAYLSSSKNALTKSISQGADAIVNKIYFAVRNIAEGIERHYQNILSNRQSKKISYELHEGFHLISNLVKRIDNVSNAIELSKEISESIANLDVAVSSNIDRDTQDIFFHGKYLQFLELLYPDDSLNTWSSEWKDPLRKTELFLNESEKWYTFLDNLYAKLSEYEIQENARKYNVQNIDNWGVDSKTQGIFIAENNFKQFLDKLKKYNIKELHFVATMAVTQSHLQALNKILRLTLMQNFEKDCSKSGKLAIRGSFIRFSDFTEANGKIKDLCQRGSKFASVDIFSTNTVFIDRDIQEKGTILNINVISPNLHVIGSRKIILDGSTGNNVTRYGLSKQGHNGRPGLPGGPGGNFLAITSQIINGSYLTVSVNGGEGGRGEDGGAGEDGRPGQDATPYRYYDKQYLDDRWFVSLVFNSYGHIYRLYGMPGEKGGRGGDGGIGGFGGAAGKIKIVTFDNSLKQLTLRHAAGPIGLNGKGGIGGKGGRNGKDLRAKYCSKYIILVVPIQKRWCETEELDNFTKGPNGDQGENGKNTVGRQPSEQPADFENIANFVNNYKVYLRSNLNDSYNVIDFIQFTSELDSNMEIKKA